MKILKSEKNKRILVAALFLIVGLLLAVTFDAYGKTQKNAKARMAVEAIDRVKKEMLLEAHIHQMTSEDPETRLEKMTRVTAAVEPKEAKVVVTETPFTEPVEEIEEADAQEAETVDVDAQEAETEKGDAKKEKKDSSSEEAKEQQQENGEYYSSSDLRFMGEIYSGGFRYTWYSQNVLPGGGLNIPGRHVDENGYVCDENDRICLASVDFAYGTVVSTPFGKEGCVYDSGCDSGTLDVYVDF